MERKDLIDLVKASRIAPNEWSDELIVDTFLHHKSIQSPNESKTVNRNENAEKDCVHNPEQQTLRCMVCLDCGEILDVID